MIVYTGDFLCRSEIGDKLRLKNFFSSLSAPFGCFAVLGNHDYSRYICINKEGRYDTHKPLSKTMRFLKQIKLTGTTTEKAVKPPFHQELIELLKSTPFKLLHNETVRLPIGVNICGLGEYMAGHCDPEKAFAGQEKDEPVIVLVHNPDAVPRLKTYPANLILCGHTHGAQVNLPLLRDRLTPMENPKYKRGLKWENGRWIYTNRGLSGVSPIRLFSPPEIAFFTLVRE
jgi:predicted MPP superfamily phosphohydrolase